MLSDAFIKPGYGGHCFAEIPPTIKYLLTGEGALALSPDLFGSLPHRYKRVIFFFVDAFGWWFFDKYAADYPFLQRIQADGVPGDSGFRRVVGVSGQATTNTSDRSR